MLKHMHAMCSNIDVFPPRPCIGRAPPSKPTTRPTPTPTTPLDTSTQAHTHHHNDTDNDTRRLCAARQVPPLPCSPHISRPILPRRFFFTREGSIPLQASLALAASVGWWCAARLRRRARASPRSTIPTAMSSTRPIYSSTTRPTAS